MRKTFILLITSILLFFSSCQSGKLIQQNIRTLQADLDYDLTSSVYLKEISKFVFLDSIDSSFMPTSTTVKRKGGFVVPLILYNYQKDRFRVTLGEESLSQPYKEFLSDALLAECNRSSCFNLEKEKNSDYTLKIQILDNETSAYIHDSKNYIFIPSESELYLDWNNLKVKNIKTNLSVSVCFSKNEKVLFERIFSTQFKLSERKAYEENLHEICLSEMSECLSFATKQIVEEIVPHLHLAMLGEIKYLQSLE